MASAHKIEAMRGEKTGRRGLLAAAIAAAALIAGSVNPAGAAAARGMDLGIYEPEFSFPTPSLQTAAFDRASQAHAGFALVYVTWSGVAPTSKPAGFNAANPADPAYDFSAIDTAVRDASARSLQVLLAITKAPPWAEGPNRPSAGEAPQGTWEPNPQDVGDFAHAVAARYSGNFGGLPAVRHYQLWAEPNLGVNLSPQWLGNTPVSPTIYRAMLNAFYSNVKAVSPRNVVLTGGTAPYGNLTPAGGLTYQRMQPLAFWRGLLCYSAGKRKGHKKRRKHGRAVTSRALGNKLIPQPCPNPAHFDIAAHHPINVGAPTRAALNPDDISTPDLYKLKRVLAAAAASGRLAPGGAKPIWATELWWNSSPPGDKGLSLAQQARYLEQGFYVLWKQGVGATFWFELRDAVPSGGLPIPTSGLFFRDGRAKPALTAYQFPFVTERLSGKRVRAWGEAPHAGSVDIQIGRKRFRHLKTLGAGDNRVFTGILHLGGHANLRAVQGTQTSLVWRQG